MSFILDALKKSESDRQGKNRPENAYTPTGAGDSSPSRWLMIVGILLLVNVVVVLVVTLWPEPADVTPVTTDNHETAETADSFRDLVASARDRQNSQPIDMPTVAAPRQAMPTTPEPARQMTVEPTVSPPTSTAVHKSFNEVRADGTVQLPDLHLDLHVYNSKPAERFVFINMNKYGENSTLSEGPIVREIVPEGVILEYLGTRFLLPRE